MAEQTLVVPLTTTFTPPASCSNIPWLYEPGTYSTTTTQDVIEQAWAFYTSDGFDEPGTWTSCWPSSFNPYGFSTTYIYSPGLCPAGYTTGYQTISSVVGESADQDKTYAICCPSGYTVGDQTYLDFAYCDSTFTTPVYVPVTGDYNIGTSVVFPTSSQSITISRGVASKYGVVVMYGASDLSVFPAGYTPGLLASITSTPSMSSTFRPAPADTSTYTSGTSSPGGSDNTFVYHSGVRVPILVGVLVPVIVLFVAAISGCTAYRRRRRGQNYQAGSAPPTHFFHRRQHPQKVPQHQQNPYRQQGYEQQYSQPRQFSQPMEVGKPSFVPTMTEYRREEPQFELGAGAAQPHPTHTTIMSTTAAPTYELEAQQAAAASISPPLTSTTHDRRLSAATPTTTTTTSGTITRKSLPSTTHELETRSPSSLTTTAAATDTTADASTAASAGASDRDRERDRAVSPMHDQEWQRLEEEERRIRERKAQLWRERGR